MIQQNLLQMIQAEKVEWKTLGEVCQIKKGKQLNKTGLKDQGLYPAYNGGKGHSGYTDNFNVEADTIIISQGGASAGFVNFIKVPFWANAHCYYVLPHSNIINRYLYHFLKNNERSFMDSQYGAGIPALSQSALEKVAIPIPPLETQQKIVKILDKMTELEATLEAELSQRRRQYEYYRNALLDFDNRAGGVIAKFYPDCLKDVAWKTLGEVAENLNFMRRPITSGLREAGNIPYYGASGVVDYVKDYIFDGDFLLISEDGANLLARKTPIAFSISGKSWVNNHAHILKFATYAERRFIEFYLNNIDLTPYISGSAQPKLNKQSLNSIKVPNPPLEIQQKIVAILDQFDTLTQSISDGLPREIALRLRQYEYYRGQLLNFAPAA